MGHLYLPRLHSQDMFYEKKMQNIRFLKALCHDVSYNNSWLNHIITDAKVKNAEFDYINEVQSCFLSSVGLGPF